MDGGRFFGAFRACSGIKDAVVLNHVPVGCNWGTGMFKTISNQPDVRHACTVMHEKEIIFGGEVALKKALKRADRHYDAPLLIVISGDVPNIIGDDVSAVIDSVSLQKEVICVEAAGYKGFMRDGYEEALVQLSDRMKHVEQTKNSINLIGFCPDDFKASADIMEMKRLMSEVGVKLNCVISSCYWDEFVNAPRAEVNVVLGQGEKLAMLMKKRFGLPYFKADYPYGLEGTKKLLDAICDRLGNGHDTEINLEPFERIYLYLHELYGTPISVIGDFHAVSMACFLKGELGFEIEALFNVEDDYHAFEDAVKSSNSMILFGSSFERRLAQELNIPLLRYVYPVFDQISIFDQAPYAGFRGAVFLTETILNAVMGFDDMINYELEVTKV